ncbi:hypothetical protein MTR67_045650 [Solanum verrucosum]|uniref:Uncharacterized protein n=1 Tax=Solanum verrucosum TaxID=315347 RepID=A0AAF0ZWU6_SOLVR|nr:hypothetical protein MTR67_045650 [Solanum verrucosum]
MPVRVVETSSALSQPSGGTSGNTLPSVCTLLSVGQAFSGTQNVSSQQKDEAWRVNVRIQGCDLDHGYLCGTMEALNVPMADTPSSTHVHFYCPPSSQTILLLFSSSKNSFLQLAVIATLSSDPTNESLAPPKVVTFWEGEIVDTKNYTFFTGKWGATSEDDIKHWTKFPSFSPLLVSSQSFFFKCRLRLGTGPEWDHRTGTGRFDRVVDRYRDEPDRNYWDGGSVPSHPTIYGDRTRTDRNGPERNGMG